MLKMWCKKNFIKESVVRKRKQGSSVVNIRCPWKSWSTHREFRFVPLMLMAYDGDMWIISTFRDEN